MKLDKFDQVKNNLEKIVIMLGTKNSPEDIALLMLNTLKLIEGLNLDNLEKDQAVWLNQKIQAIDEYIQNIKTDIIAKIQDKEKELILIDDIVKNLQEIT